MKTIIDLKLFISEFKVIPLPDQTVEDIVGIKEKVFVSLQVLSVHDTNHQSLLDGLRLAWVMLHAVTNVPLRLNDQQTKVVLVFFTFVNCRRFPAVSWSFSGISAHCWDSVS